MGSENTRLLAALKAFHGDARLILNALRGIWISAPEGTELERDLGEAFLWFRAICNDAHQQIDAAEEQQPVSGTTHIH